MLQNSVISAVLGRSTETISVEKKKEKEINKQTNKQKNTLQD